jgi:transcriptional regulator with XRE-family HTH domain
MKEEGKSSREIANEIGVSHTAINKLETSDTCPKLPDSPEPSNVVKAPVEFKKPPVQNEVPDDYDEEEEEDLEEIDDNTIYQVVKKDPEKELKALGLKLQDSLDFLMHWGKHIQPVLDNPIALNGVSPDVIGEMVLLANQNLNRLKEFFPTITKAERR